MRGLDGKERGALKHSAFLKNIVSAKSRAYLSNTFIGNAVFFRTNNLLK